MYISTYLILLRFAFLFLSAKKSLTGQISMLIRGRHGKFYIISCACIWHLTGLVKMTVSYHYFRLYT